MAEKFNKFFVTVAGDKDNKIIHTNTNYPFFLSPANEKRL